MVSSRDEARTRGWGWGIYAAIPLLRVMARCPDSPADMEMSLIVPLSCIPEGSFRVTTMWRPINSLAMVPVSLP